jgi:catechol 2,3-dioxygenase-like lactoylglutathione lyase family enzyme
MFANTEAYSGFASPDLDKSREFYGEKLGLNVSELEPGALLQLELAGGRNTLIYIKPDFEPATYTILNFVVDDVEAAVDQLTERGVEIERYDGFDQDDKGIDSSGPGGGIAWFKDPAGNILSVHGQG